MAFCGAVAPADGQSASHGLELASNASSARPVRNCAASIKWNIQLGTVHAADLLRLQGWDLANIDFKVLQWGIRRVAKAQASPLIRRASGRSPANLWMAKRQYRVHRRHRALQLEWRDSGRRSLLVVRPAVGWRNRAAARSGLMALFRRTNSAGIALNPVGSGSHRRVWPIRQTICLPLYRLRCLISPRSSCRIVVVADLECLPVAAR